MKTLEKRAGTNVFWLFLSDLLLRGSIFVGTLYLARVLGAEKFGVFSFAIAMANYLWLIVDLGIARYGEREVATNNLNAKELLDELNSFRFFVSVLVFSTFCLVINFLQTSNDKLIFFAAGFFVIAFALNPDWLIRGIEEMKYLVIGNLITGIFFLLGVFLFINGPEETSLAVLFWSLSFLISAVATLIIIWRYLGYKFRLVIKTSKWKKHFATSIHFALSGSLIRINNFLSIILLGFLVLPQDLGIFSAPHRLILTIVNLIFIIPKAFYPILSSQQNDIEKFRVSNEKFYTILLILGLPIGIIGFYFAQDLIELFFGNQYSESSSVFKILIWQIPINFLALGFVNSLFSRGLQKINTYIIGFGVLLKLILSLILIPKIGIYGAAISDLIGSIVVLILLIFFFSLNVYRINPFKINLFKIFLSCLILVFLINSFDSELNIVMRLMVLGISYIMLIFLFRIITIDSIKKIFMDKEEINQ